MKITPQLAIFSVTSTLAYLWLAVLGEGGFAAFFSHQPLLVLALVTLTMSGVALRSEGNLSSGIREDRSNRWVLWIFGVIGLLAAYVPAYSDRTELWTFGGEPVRWIGVVLFTAGGALRLWPVFILGHRFSGLVALQAGHTLVTDGPYAVIRHPSYLGLLINSLGWALAFRSGLGIVLTALTIPPLLARIKAEERLIGTAFGAEYAAYRARTAKLLPGLY